MTIRVVPQMGPLHPVFCNVPDGTYFVRWQGQRYYLDHTLHGRPHDWTSKPCADDYCDHVPTLDVPTPA